MDSSHLQEWEPRTCNLDSQQLHWILLLTENQEEESIKNVQRISADDGVFSSVVEKLSVEHNENTDTWRFLNAARVTWEVSVDIFISSWFGASSHEGIYLAQSVTRWEEHNCSDPNSNQQQEEGDSDGQTVGSE